MQSLQEQLKAHEQDINSFTPANATELENYRIKYLGTKGIVKAILGEMKNVPVEQKKEAGQLLNSFKQLAEAKYDEFKHLQEGGKKKANGVDITLPGTPLRTGSR